MKMPPVVALAENLNPRVPLKLDGGPATILNANAGVSALANVTSEHTIAATNAWQKATLNFEFIRSMIIFVPYSMKSRRVADK
jgi:hypothetical protein